MADLRAGGRARKFVQAPGKADIVLEFTDGTGKRHRETIVGYTGGGFQCNANVEINPDYTVTTRVDYNPEKKSWLAFS
jgi:hypothetical protein